MKRFTAWKKIEIEVKWVIGECIRERKRDLRYHRRMQRKFEKLEGNAEEGDNDDTETETESDEYDY